jgi:hypothetical protein
MDEPNVRIYKEILMRDLLIGLASRPRPINKSLLDLFDISDIYG